jgi:hypothetical protein
LRNLIAAIPLLCVFVLSTSFGVVSPTDKKRTPIIINDKTFDKNTITDQKASTLYSDLHLAEKGLSEKAFQYAYKGFQILLEKKLLKENANLAICDFSQSSRLKRLYVVNIFSGEVLMNTWVAHGRNSGLEFAKKFSNKPRSLQSSLGFFITRQTYYGAHGLSLRLDGVERGINDKALRRAIVIHGADYIGDETLVRNNYMGRSYGCPAVPQAESETLINFLKNGSCLFIYYPTKLYLQGSKILNG